MNNRVINSLFSEAFAASFIGLFFFFKKPVVLGNALKL